MSEQRQIGVEIAEINERLDQVEITARRVCGINKILNTRIATLESAIREVIREMVKYTGESPAPDDDWSMVHGWIAALRAGLGEDEHEQHHAERREGAEG